MVKTVNRQPYSVNQIKYSDIKYKYFTHNEWKGVCDDKNYLSIDQFTFADSNNVYVDAEGILKSRPSVKLRKDKFNGPHIKDVYYFGSFVVYYKSIGTTSQLLFYKDDTLVKTVDVDENFKLVYADNKIFVFEPGKISHLNTVPVGDSYIYIDNDKTSIYVPIVETIVGNARTELESKNVLTGNYKSRYLYGNEISLNAADLYNNSVDITVGDTVYGHRTFEQNTERTIIEPCYTLPDNCTENGNYLFWTNDAGITMYAQKVTSSEGKTTYNLFYSINGRFYEQLPYLADTIGYPALSTSSDHVFAVLFKENGAYAYTLGGAAIDNGERVAYSTWTKLPSTSDTLVKPQGDFFDETAFAYIDVKSNGQDLYTCKNSTVRKHTNFSLTNSEYGDVSICCSPSVTSVVNINDDDGQAIQNWYYNDDADVVIKIYGEDYHLIVSGAATTKNHLFASMFKQKAYDRALTSAVYNMSYDIETVYFSEEDIYNHNAVIPDEQTTYRSVFRNIYKPLVTDEYRIALSTYQSIVSKKALIVGETVTGMIDTNTLPLGFVGENYYCIEGNTIYTSDLSKTVYIDLLHVGDYNLFVFDREAELSEYFISKGNTLYISSTGAYPDASRDFQWYFPEINTQVFDYDITNLHPISTEEIAVFLKDSIYYVNKSTATINNIEQTVYSYYKSRIPLGCEEGSDVITSYDNKYTMFVTKRGFVAMAYQDFISSQEQALTFLSDEIFDLFNNWNEGPTKLFQYNFWIILYKPLNAKSFIFDMRSNSWWPIEYNNKGLKLIELDRKPILINSNGYLYSLDTSNDNYYDGNSLEDGRINWHITSQKLHLDAINYYKHIVNLTLFGYNYGSEDALMKFNLRVINYRKQTDTNETKSFESVEYKIQLTRTFVKRINYYKVNQMQYVIESCRDVDEYDEHPIPLSLTCISVKYLVTGQVR